MNEQINEKSGFSLKKMSRRHVPDKISKKFKRTFSATVGQIFWSQIRIAGGSLLAAFGFALFQIPFNLAAGGISGLGIILNHFIAFPIGLIILVLNIPLLILGFYHLGGWRFVLSSLLAVLVFSLGIDFFDLYLPVVNKNWPLTEDLLLASIYAGVLVGLGMGIVYRAGGTIGGTSIPARILNDRKGFPMSQSFLFTDGAIILIAGFVFNWEVALLAILTLVFSGIFSDFVLEGISQVRTATIVTQKPEDVRWAILYKLGRGVSLWTVEGGFLKKNRTMLYCTVLRSRISDLKYAIATVDSEAFIVIGVAQQVVGGYSGSPRFSPANAETESRAG